MATKYYVYTWDIELQRFTPQIGVPYGPYTLFGLRVPMRELANMGYAGRGDDPCVLVTTEGDPESKDLGMS